MTDAEVAVDEVVVGGGVVVVVGLADVADDVDDDEEDHLVADGQGHHRWGLTVAVTVYKRLASLAASPPSTWSNGFESVCGGSNAVGERQANQFN